MSDDELDISAALAKKSPAKSSRKRKSTSKDEPESPERDEYPSVFGAMGTPMAKLENAKEWDDWKEKELEKERKKWKAYLRSKWRLEQDKLPMVSDSKYYLGRHEHYANIDAAQEIVEDGLDAFNEKFNVGKGAAINIQINGKDLPPKQAKKFAHFVEKAVKKAGKPKIDDIFNDDMDEDEAYAEKEWARKRAKKVREQRYEDAELDDLEEDVKFSAWNEFTGQMEDEGTDHLIGEKHYKKWLLEKIEKNEPTEHFNDYQIDLILLDKNAFKDKKSLKTVVKGVQNFYRKMRGPK